MLRAIFLYIKTEARFIASLFLPGCMSEAFFEGFLCDLLYFAKVSLDAVGDIRPAILLVPSWTKVAYSTLVPTATSVSLASLLVMLPIKFPVLRIFSASM